MFNKYKMWQVMAMSASQSFSVLLLHPIYQFSECTFQIREVLAHIQEDSVEAPKAWYIFRMETIL